MYWKENKGTRFKERKENVSKGDEGGSEMEMGREMKWKGKEQWKRKQKEGEETVGGKGNVMEAKIEWKGQI